MGLVFAFFAPLHLCVFALNSFTKRASKLWVGFLAQQLPHRPLQSVHHAVDAVFDEFLAKINDEGELQIRETQIGECL